jgi:hypothetical protein
MLEFIHLLINEIQLNFGCYNSKAPTAFNGRILNETKSKAETVNFPSAIIDIVAEEKHHDDYNVLLFISSDGSRWIHFKYDNRRSIFQRQQ